MLALWHKGSSKCSMSGKGVLGLVFNISYKCNRVGTHADLDPAVGTMPAKAVPRGKVSSSSALKMKLESPPITQD